MAKKLKEILKKAEPTTKVSKGDEAFIKKHDVQVTSDANGNDDEVFKASNVKTYDRNIHHHGYHTDEDEGVYESHKKLSPKQKKYLDKDGNGILNRKDFDLLHKEETKLDEGFKTFIKTKFSSQHKDYIGNNPPHKVGDEVYHKPSGKVGKIQYDHRDGGKDELHKYKVTGLGDKWIPHSDLDKPKKDGKMLHDLAVKKKDPLYKEETENVDEAYNKDAVNKQIKLNKAPNAKKIHALLRGNEGEHIKAAYTAAVNDPNDPNVERHLKLAAKVVKTKLDSGKKIDEETETPKHRPLHQIAKEISKNWKNPYFGAKPYLDALKSLSTVHDNYGQDSGHSVLAYGLSNMNSYSGKSTNDPELAKKHRSELKAHLKDKPKVVSEETLSEIKNKDTLERYKDKAEESMRRHAQAHYLFDKDPNYGPNHKLTTATKKIADKHKEGIKRANERLKEDYPRSFEQTTKDNLAQRKVALPTKKDFEIVKATNDHYKEYSLEKKKQLKDIYRPQEYKKLKEEYLNESKLKLVMTHNNGPHTAKVYRNPEHNEWQVKFFKNGKHLSKADSFHSDAEDAHNTAKAELKHMAKNMKEDLDEGFSVQKYRKQEDQNFHTKNLGGYMVNKQGRHIPYEGK